MLFVAGLALIELVVTFAVLLGKVVGIDVAICGIAAFVVELAENGVVVIVVGIELVVEPVFAVFLVALADAIVGELVFLVVFLVVLAVPVVVFDGPFESNAEIVVVELVEPVVEFVEPVAELVEPDATLVALAVPVVAVVGLVVVLDEPVEIVDCVPSAQAELGIAELVLSQPLVGLAVGPGQFFAFL